MKNTPFCDTLIVGGGPAGLFTAIHLDGQDVVLLEKNNRPGKKLLISGSGRCNVTHDGPIRDFLSHYGENSRFLKNALFTFTNDDLREYFTQQGITFMTDKNAKVFPSSNDAGDLLHILVNHCITNKINVQTGQEADRIENTEEGFRVRCNSGIYHSRNLVIATGGKSYPGTGSTGDGYRFAQMLGHSIIPPRPALTPVVIREYPFIAIAGVSLCDTAVSIFRNNKKLKEANGDVLFTHNGLSGPGILDLSRYMEEQDTLKINLCGANPEVFRNEFIGNCSKNGKTALLTYLKKYNLPRSLIREVLSLLNIKADIPLAMIDKKTRIKLTDAFCELPLKIEKKEGFSTAMVTAGGVSLEEVDPKTLQSKLVKNLYFAGEVLDYDGDTGGYNLQAAFSTAFVVARSIRQSKIESQTTFTGKL